MPTYEYECPKCAHRFEKLQAITAPPLKTCPRCKSRRLKRLIGTGAGILFKGSGFYQTDYRSESYRTDAKKEADSASAPKTEAAEKPKAKTDKKEHKGGKKKAGE
jgi:putative FmdB family regulatory protein